MENRINKPRVFLSHAKRDIDFINQLQADFRRCQIEPWLDSDMIRDGRPWLKVIFEDGIPSCDVILAYFTEHSLDSKMVAKEIDAALIEQLKNSGISFLPYVSSKEVRDKLRLDIQSLHCREWHSENYSEILPSVVAEIWRGYHERSVGLAVLQERNRRLELELEVKRLEEKSAGSIFSASEERDFEYIYSQLIKPMKLASELYEHKGATTKDELIRKEEIDISILFIALLVFDSGQAFISTRNALSTLKKWIALEIENNVSKLKRVFNVFSETIFTIELRHYGLTKPVFEDDRGNQVFEGYISYRGFAHK